jgi:hypothetical protein
MSFSKTAPTKRLSDISLRRYNPKRLNRSTEHLEHILARLSIIEKENTALIKDNKILMNNLDLVNIDIENLKSDMQILQGKYNTLLTTNNNIDMGEICSQNNQKLPFSSLFKVNNKTVSPPMADIINTVND